MGSKELQSEKEKRISSIKSQIQDVVLSLNNLDKPEEESAFIYEAVQEACKAALKGNYGIGAVIVHQKKIIARGQNRICEKDDSMHHVLHAEMDALRNYHEKVSLDKRKLDELCLYTTLEPCPMCTCGIFNAGVRKVVAGSADPLGGQLISNSSLMPPLWLDLLKQSGTTHKIANVNPILKNACDYVFKITRDALDEALTQNKL